MQITNVINFSNVKGDVFGGLTAAVIALPMALAFGVASGAGPEAGLYGAVLVGLFAAIFGGTPTLISEPTGPMTVIMTSVVASMIARYPVEEFGPDYGLSLAFGVVILAGVFQIIFGALRLGSYVTLMPYTVISGFMSGIGIILVVLQSAPFLGQATPKGGVIGVLQAAPDLIQNLNLAETSLGLITIAILFFTPRQWKRVLPPQLLALVAGTLLSLVLFPEVDLRRIGQISAGLPTLHIPTFPLPDLQLMVVDAAVLGMLGCIDALLTSVVADSLTRTEHNSNKELIGQGIGNVVSGFFGGLPGAGATMGTVVNIQTGGRTALSGITRAVILLVVVVWAAPLTQSIPMAVLAGIALKVGIDIIDWEFLKRAHKISIKAALIMYGVIALTVLVDLMVAVGVGVFIANVLTIDRLSKLRSKDVKAITDADDAIILTEEEKDLLKTVRGQVLLFHLSGPMIFGVAKAISREHNLVNNYKVLIFDLTDVPLLGVTSSLAIENAIEEALDNGRTVFVVGASGKTFKRLQDLGLLDRLEPQQFQVTRTEALKQSVSIVHAQGGVVPDSHLIGTEESTYENQPPAPV
ncbi:MAG: SulP family inorganic anion transporter [Prochlorothrix sp.]|nr:SulP family inorganic anion transporter [Prochlorothrix sp.]